jgi:hypothetical protein
MNYSEAFQKLIADGGRITRAYWTSEEYRSGCDRIEGDDHYVVAITARELELPRGRGVWDGPARALFFVKDTKRGSAAEANDWEPLQADILANDWSWLPRRETM